MPTSTSLGAPVVNRHQEHEEEWVAMERSEYRLELVDSNAVAKDKRGKIEEEDV